MDETEAQKYLDKKMVEFENMFCKDMGLDVSEIYWRGIARKMKRLGWKKS